MKKGFTLIELLIVVVVIATLMGLVFRLAGVGGDQAARNKTITRMQKLEFALSGYFSAFGSYPPVPLHGTRDIFCGVNKLGVQMPSGGSSENNDKDKLNWLQVRAACLSQPVACEFPFNSESTAVSESIKRLSESYKDYGEKWSSISSFGINYESRLSNNRTKYAEWTKVQLFKFGVMSYLLPRYLFMLAGPIQFYDGSTSGYKKDSQWNVQWRSQNNLEKLFKFSNGRRLYTDREGWRKLQEDTNQRKNTTTTSDYNTSEYRAILMQPSQAVCARWMQALDGIVTGGRTFYGVNTQLEHNDGHFYQYHESSQQSDLQMMSGIYSSGDGDTVSNPYILDGMTVRDGWGMDLFYYSPPPYQSYRLWSAGPNGKTIPPWVDLNSSKMSKHRETAAEWMADDIVGLSTPSN